MGEFASYQGERIKIGVCDELFFLRFEDRDKVTPLPNNVDPGQDTELFFRVPIPAEDNTSLSRFQHLNPARAASMYNTKGEPFTDPTLEPGSMQVKHECGLLLSIPCHHGAKLPDLGPGTKVHWNGKDRFFLGLRFLKLTKDYTVLPTVECKYCKKKWTYHWADIWDYLAGTYQYRFKKYREQEEKFHKQNAS